MYKNSNLENSLLPTLEQLRGVVQPALLAADRIDAASLLAEAVELLRTEHLDCEPGEGCGRCDAVRDFLQRAANNGLTPN